MLRLTVVWNLVFQLEESRIEGKTLDKIDRSLCCLRESDVSGQPLGSFLFVFCWLVTFFVLIVSNYIYISADCLIVAS